MWASPQTAALELMVHRRKPTVRLSESLWSHGEGRSGNAKPSHMTKQIKFVVFPICLANAIHHFSSNLNPSPSKTPPKRWTSP